MTGNSSILLAAIGAPPREFWENDLELPIDPILTKAAESRAIDCWFVGRHGPERLVLYRLLTDAAARTGNRKLGMQAMIPYMLVHEFTKYKSKAAITEYAQHALSAPWLDMCRTNAGAPDPNAACFAMYQQDPTQLLTILCLDKAYRSGFALMRLRENIRRPQQDLSQFLIPENVIHCLQTADAGEHPCELRRILHDNDRHTVFIRRAERPDRIIRDGRMVHGYHPEWIILEFFDSAKHVRIASASNAPPLEIANRIATAYYGVSCEYENEHLVTYRRQLCLFLRQLQAGQDKAIRLVEVDLLNTPLDGSPNVTISHVQSVGAAIGHFERAIGSVLTDIEQLGGVTIVFNERLVNLAFERLQETDDRFAVKCSDQRLTPSERHELQEYLKVTYGIATESAERRFSGAA